MINKFINRHRIPVWRRRELAGLAIAAMMMVALSALAIWLAEVLIF